MIYGMEQHMIVLCFPEKCRERTLGLTNFIMDRLESFSKDFLRGSPLRIDVAYYVELGDA